MRFRTCGVHEDDAGDPVDDHGEELALSSEFDREREIVLKGGHHGYVALLKEGNPDDMSLSVSTQRHRRVADDEPLIAILASFWGIPIFTDSLFERPVNDVSELFVLQEF